jgi:hypothetical protein
VSRPHPEQLSDCGSTIVPQLIHRVKEATP